VNINVRWAYNSSHYITLNPASQFNAHWSCMLSFLCLLPDYISWLIDIALCTALNSKIHPRPTLRLRMSLWLHGTVCTRYFVHHHNVSDSVWPLCGQSGHPPDLESIRLPLALHHSITNHFLYWLCSLLTQIPSRALTVIRIVNCADTDCWQWCSALHNAQLTANFAVESSMNIIQLK